MNEREKQAGRALKRLVAAHGQAAVAEMLQTTDRSVRRWERGKAISEDFAERILELADELEANSADQRHLRDKPIRAQAEAIAPKAIPPQEETPPNPAPVGLLDPLPGFTPALAAAKVARPGVARKIARAVVDLAAGATSDGIEATLDGKAVTLPALRLARFIREGRAIGPPAGRDWTASEARRILAADRQRCENILRRLKESGVEVHGAEDVETGVAEQPVRERFSRGKTLRDAHELRGSFRSMRGF